MKIKNQCEKLIAVVLTVSIIVTSFSSLAQISAQTEEGTSIQATQVAASEEIGVQTASRPVEPTKEFIISNENTFTEFMIDPEHWGSNVKVNLAYDIDMKGKVFNPIKEFSGVFDGCGHTISNLKIQSKSGKGKNVEFALINTLNEYAEIKNVTLDNYTIEGKSAIKKAAGLAITNHGTVLGVDILNGSISNIHKETKAAGFVLNNEVDGVIENCHIENMSAKDSKIRSGFVGTNYGNITNCSTILSENSKDIVGGFVCENLGVIEKCSSKGDVFSKNCAGGFCGINAGEIVSCKSEGLVKASAKKGATICGGFVGENSGIIKDCSSTGKVEGQEYTGAFVGINSSKGEISSCKTKSDIKSHTYIASIYCGGFAGLNEGNIEVCTFDGKVDGCVDSEKMVGTAVGVAIGVILIFAAILLLARSYKHIALTRENMVSLNKERMSLNNSVKELVDNNIFRNHCDNEEQLNLIVWNLFNYSNDLSDISIKIDLDYPKYSQILTKYYNEYYKFYKIMNIFAKSDYYKEFSEQYKMIICNYWKNHYNYCNFHKKYHGFASTICSFGKYNLFSSLIAVPIISFIGGTASGVAMRFTAGCKFANIGAFCGFNIGEINKCDAKINSVKARTLYNKYNMCGGFVGVNGKNGTIKDCNVTGNGINNKTYTGGHLGGFVGKNSGKVENGTTNISVANGKYTGGFCGNNLGKLSGSKSEGSAAVDAKTLTNKTKCGGFVGNNDEKGKIDGCISTGSLIGQEYAGGFCGDNNGKILNSISEGNVISRTVSSDNCCGGFVGENGGNVKDCASKGSAAGQEYVGGFCGDNKGGIAGSKSEGNATASTKVNINRCGGFIGNNEDGKIVDCISTGSAIGEEFVGGFAGVNKSDIIDCNANGKAAAKTKKHTALVGGFVGENEKGTITNCVATGGTDARSTSGQAKAGGFVGVNRASIMSSKAIGYVYLSAGTCHKDDGCGGFVGRNDKDSRIDGCYAECTIGTTNKKKGGGFVGEAVGKSTIMNSWCKAKIVTKLGIKNNKKFCQDKDKEAVIKDYFAN